MKLTKEDLVLTEDKNESNIMVGGVKLNTYMSKMGLSPITKMVNVEDGSKAQEGGGLLQDLAVPTILFVGNYLFNNGKNMRNKSNKSNKSNTKSNKKQTKRGKIVMKKNSSKGLKKTKKARR